MGKNLNSLLYGNDLFGFPIERSGIGPVAARFTFPPFSVLDTRSGDWQDRKRAWLSIGIKSEVGRDAVAYTCNNKKYTKKYTYMPRFDTGTSIFDPCLCECVCRWFCPENGQIIDPFSGGSVRGMVAHYLGFKYWGCDLRQEQVDANNKQINDSNGPIWICGDAADKLKEAPACDFVFSCPPYGDLEKYSDDPRDLSAMDYGSFIESYGEIIGMSIERLIDDRFACFVVGDFRDAHGYYRDFISTTIRLFRDHGAQLYNEAVLISPVGSACMRVTKHFNSSRKMEKTHQNVLVFCKGDWKKAANVCKNGSKQ